MGDNDSSEPRALPEGAEARGTVRAPVSKSHLIRQVVCAALQCVQEPDDSEDADDSDGADLEYDPIQDDSEGAGLGRDRLPDDAVAALRGLDRLGWRVSWNAGQGNWRVDASEGPVPFVSAEVDVGGSGTALRLLAAVCAIGQGPYTITGTPQLLRRPAGAIVPALQALGLTVEARRGDDGVLRPPLVISGGPVRGGEVVVDASASSQTISALLLVAPLLARELRPFIVRSRGEIASRPHVDLTVAVMREYGGEVDIIEDADSCAWIVHPEYGDSNVCDTERDWSSAAYLLAAAAATGGDVVVEGLNARSVQADRRIVDLLVAFGAGALVTGRGVRCTGRADRAVDIDLHDAPDLAPLVGALACLVPGTSRVRGAAHLRIKETDRIAEVVRCARAWGCDARELDDGFEITGPALHGATIDPAGDHRLAMAFAVAGLAVPGTRIANPGCVTKSYRTFWHDLEQLTGRA